VPTWLRFTVFVLCLLPLGWLIYALVMGSLGPDPAEPIMHITGEWALRMLLLTLLISPLRRWTGWNPWLKLRRMLGLYAFFYGSLHLLAYGQLFLGWTPALLWEELLERPYITAGFVGWLMMLPLAVTSTRAMRRRLGVNWRRLHRLVYAVAVLACVHLLWQARSDIGEALVYILLTGGLLAWRMKHYRPLKGRSRSPLGEAPSP
jgi:sulfoxide reductase heme-binding subunit YedZ